MKINFSSNQDFLKKSKTIFYSKIITLAILSFIIIEKACISVETYITGDGFEYVMMTEALYNHGSPDIRLSDIQNFKKDYIAVEDWNKNLKSEAFDNAERFLKDSTAYRYMSSFYAGCFADLYNKFYSYHFFTYSLLNVPARFLTNAIHIIPLKAFYITNCLLLIFTCALLLFYKPLPLLSSLLLTISFVFSANYWYLEWIHTELYTMCLVTAGLWLSYRNNNYWAIFFVSLATMQNQPLALLVLLLILKTLLENKITVPTLLKITLASNWVIWPPIFFYNHFNTTNLVNKLGFLSTEFITPTRVVGFFFDLNQGVILAIPIALILFTYLWIHYSYLTIQRKNTFNTSLLLPLVIIGITLSVSTMGNWNHGHAIINRYASWISSIILLQTFLWTEQLKITELKKNCILFSITITQIISICYFEKMNKFDWSAGINKPHVIWIMENYPHLYNPDPTIFKARAVSGPEKYEKKEPIPFYSVHEKKITKIMAHKNHMNLLSGLGFTKDRIDYYSNNNSFVLNWTYINDAEKWINKNKQVEIIETARENKIQEIIIQIKGEPKWFNDLKEKATKQNLPLDSVLRSNAIYCLDRPGL